MGEKAGAPDARVPPKVYDASTPLRPQQREWFVQSLLGGMSLSAAYRAAGFVGGSAWLASKIAKHPDIVARLEYLKGEIFRQREQHQVRANCAAVNKDQLMVQAEEMRIMALDLKRPAAAMRAIELKAHLAGLLNIRLRIRSIRTRKVKNF
jgi:hypothetical protein